MSFVAAAIEKDYRRESSGNSRHYEYNAALLHCRASRTAVFGRWPFVVGERRSIVLANDPRPTTICARRCFFTIRSLAVAANAGWRMSKPRARFYGAPVSKPGPRLHALHRMPRTRPSWPSPTAATPYSPAAAMAQFTTYCRDWWAPKPHWASFRWGQPIRWRTTWVYRSLLRLPLEPRSTRNAAGLRWGESSIRISLAIVPCDISRSPPESESMPTCFTN